MISNTTDATRGQPMRERIETRRGELEAALEQDDLSTRARADIQHALDSLAVLTTGGLDDLPAMTVAQLSDWLEKHKYLAMSNGRPKAPTRPHRVPPRPGPRSGEHAIPKEIARDTSGPLHG